MVGGGRGYNVTSLKERVYVFQGQTTREMVNRCVAAGCSNTPSDRVSLFKFPRDGALRRQWEK